MYYEKMSYSVSLCLCLLQEFPVDCTSDVTKYKLNVYEKMSYSVSLCLCLLQEFPVDCTSDVTKYKLNVL